MTSHPYLMLVILYSLAFYFSMYQSSHLAYSDASRVKLNPTLSLLMTIEQLGILGFLIWYGFVTVWYYPLILAALGLPATIIWVIIEHTLKLHRSAWAISILGILFVPVLLFLMLAHVNSPGT